jgi:hypothetical protein
LSGDAANGGAGAVAPDNGAGGKVVATGSHRELLQREPRYAATVTRGEDDR